LTGGANENETTTKHTDDSTEMAFVAWQGHCCAAASRTANNAAKQPKNATLNLFTTMSCLHEEGRRLLVGVVPTSAALRTRTLASKGREGKGREGKGREGKTEENP